MKNIFVLPSDKPSRLYIGNNGNFVFGMVKTSIQSKNNDFTNQNIYITNSEEINKDTKPCWCINTIKNTWDDDLIYYQGSMPQYHYIGFKKTILTTDPELIKNGVQEVPEYFLKWFIVGKNPIEYVEIKLHLESLDTMKNSYEIIIPQPKQETIEEVAERILANNIDGLKDLLNDDDLFYFYKGVIINYGVAVAEHQSEKTFSEEDMRNSFCNGYRANVKSSLNDSFQDWLNKFKK